MFEKLNELKHLPPKEFDAELGALLSAQHERRRAEYEKANKPKAKPKRESKSEGK